ncbi:MAG: dodecin family protein [Chlamydiia bacterium]
MSIVKVIEVISEGETIEKAIAAAIHEASHTVKDIKQIDIEHIHAKVENGHISKYRIDARISFVVKH